MYEIFVKTHFSSAHFLRNYPGKCEFLHGHNWEVEAGVQLSSLNEIDIGIDFKDLKKIVSEIVDDLDHVNLNEHNAFKDTNPSSEMIAAHIFNRMKDAFEKIDGVKPAFVTVYETPGSGVRYFE